MSKLVFSALNNQGDCVEMHVRDDGNHFIRVIDYTWMTDEEWWYEKDVPVDPEEAIKFWFDFNENFNKTCCCSVEPCPHSCMSYDSSDNESDDESS